MVRFFDHKTFLTVHGDDAILIAQQYYRTADVIKHYTAGAAQLPGDLIHYCCYTPELCWQMRKFAKYIPCPNAQYLTHTSPACCCA